MARFSLGATVDFPGASKGRFLARPVRNITRVAQAGGDGPDRVEKALEGGATAEGPSEDMTVFGANITRTAQATTPEQIAAKMGLAVALGTTESPS